MRSNVIALALLAFGVSGVAQAESVYSASFKLNEPSLPKLLTGTSLDGADSIAGEWTSNNRVDTVINARDLLSTSTDPVTGAVTPVWDDVKHSDNMHTSSGPALLMGQTTAYVYGDVSGNSGVSYTGLGATLNLSNGNGQGDAKATWNRDFSLNAHSSFTFSGFATLNIENAVGAPLSSQTSFHLGDDQSFASLSVADLADRVRTTIGASITGLSGLGADFFSYTTNPNGLLSITISNPFDTAITGTLSAGSYVNIAAYGGSEVALAVPEPSTYATLALGLGLLGAIARRKRKG